MNQIPKWKIELGFAFVVLATLVLRLKSALILGQTTFAGDTLVWHYPAFSFFAESVFGGEIPFWNPFTHAGEPYYPVLFQRRLLEPVNLLTLGLVGLFTRDIPTLFNWSVVLQLLVTSTGTYFLLRPLARHLLTRLILILVLVFSSFFFVSLRQIGMMDQFMWAPFILMVFLKIFEKKDTRWSNWILFSVLVGFNFQSYWFTGISFLFLFLALGALLFRRSLFTLNGPRFGLKMAVLLVVLGAMNGPNLVLYLERGKFVFPLRMIEQVGPDEKPSFQSLQYEGGSEQFSDAIKMTYSLVAQTGAFSRHWDFLQTITPASNGSIQSESRKYWFGAPSEAYIFIGLFPWLLALWGLLKGREPLKGVWAVVTLSFALLMLGPATPLHELLFSFFPPAWFIRNTHCLVLFFSLGVLYFFVLGLETAQERSVSWKSKRVWAFLLLVVLQFGLVLRHYPVPSHFMLYFVSIVGACTALLVTGIRRPQLSAWTGLGILALIAADLGYSHRLSKYLYATQMAPRFEKGNNILSRRKISPDYSTESLPYMGQSVRYLSQLQETPYAFSTPFESSTHNDSFESARSSKRWNSYHLLKDYFGLIHSDIPSDILAEFFSIDKPLVQFKGKTEPELAMAGLAKLPESAALKSIEDTVYLAGASVDRRVSTEVSSAFEFRTLEVKRNVLSLEVLSGSRGWLYWSDGFDTHWKASVNTVATPVLRANGNFKAIAIPEGKSQVVFSYRPDLFIWSVVVFYGLFIAGLGWHGLVLASARR